MNELVIAGRVESDDPNELVFVVRFDSLRQNILEVIDADLHAAPADL